MAIRGTVLILLTVLAGCAGGESGPCRPVAVADLPADLARNRMLVPGKVDGLPVTVQVDTGSNRTIITTAVVDQLQLPRSRHSLTRLAGVGGAVSNADVYADLDLGGGVDLQRRFADAAIPGFGALLGSDVLSDYDLDIDLAAGRVRLWRARGCSLLQLPLAGAVAIPATISGGRIRVDVEVDGQRVPALLDTGAGSSIMQASMAARLGVGPAALAADPGQVARGVDGGAISVKHHRFATESVGSVQVSRPVIGVSNFQMDDAEMLLGVDFMRGRRIWVAYRLGQVFVVGASR
jgi:predicted aspartyl protease